MRRRILLLLAALIPILVLVSVFPRGRLSGDQAPAEETEAREIQVKTERNRFQPRRFVLKPGETVKFVVHGSDVPHTFSIKQRKNSAEDLFDLEVPAGKTAAGLFTPRKAGILHLYCKQYENVGMTGRIRVR